MWMVVWCTGVRANFLQGIYGWHGEGFPVPAAKIYIGGVCRACVLRGYGDHWLGISGGVAAKELFNGASHMYYLDEVFRSASYPVDAIHIQCATN